jgi:Methyltransferase domain
VQNPSEFAAITGKIAAKAGSVFSTKANEATITWETNDPQGAEIYLITPRQGKKLISKGRGGSVRLPWVTPVHRWRFELYSVSRPEQCLDHVEIPHRADPLGSELDKLALEAKTSYLEPEKLVKLIAQAALRCVRNRRYPEFFHVCEEVGVHVTPVHFYQPIPDTRELSPRIWEQPSDLPGIEMNEAGQLDFLRIHFPRFREEYDQFPITTDDPSKFSLINGRFDAVDALAAYCMVRYFQPRTIIEVGSGYSSLISAQAAVKNGNCPLICIEPFPIELLKKGFPGLKSLVEKKVQEVERDFFSQLEPGDILFLDSSHTVKIDGDVNYLFFEILPRLKPGVIVHVHDIALPFDYPRAWVMDQCRFWTEQYLLQAFLMFNSDFEVLLANRYLLTYHLKELKETFPRSPSWGGGSFWMRRRSEARPSI